jgi:mono/diheme cytochrome c family protein
MSPIITSIAGLAATLTGACAMLLMLEMRGNPGKDSKANQRLIKAHKVTGYIFIAFFIIILAIMLSKAASYQEEFSPRTILHISLALLVIPLLLFKILIIRRFKRFERQIPGIGLAVFLSLFLLNSMTAGYYFLHETDIDKLSLSEEDAAVLDEEKGQKLVAQKCGRCHTLERVFKSLKTDQDWTDTINRMISFDAFAISEDQGKQILNYLINQQKRREKLVAEASGALGKIGRNIVEQKCSFCHGLDRIYLADKTHEEWVEIVDNMIGYSEQVEFMSPQEKEAVIDFLSNRSSTPLDKKNDQDNTKTK